MSVAIPNGRKWFYQWDLNQVLEVKDHPIGTPVHFSLHEHDTSEALIVETYAVGEKIVADVPNILLQNYGQLHVYVYPINNNEGHTEEHWKFEIRKREKPSDYVYTETEVLTVKKVIEDALRDAKEKGEFDGTPGKTAYQYAQDGGYTGTEAEFAAKLAEEVYSKEETDAAISEATNEGRYELIETINISEDTASIERTTEPNGTPYNYKSILLKIYFRNDAHSYNKYTLMEAIFGETSLVVFRSNEGTPTGEQVIRTYREYGYVRGEISGVTTNASHLSGGFSVYSSHAHLLTENNITQIILTEEEGFMVDDVIQIWGVRA